MVRRRYLASLICFIFLLPFSARGQSPDGTISGLVTDPSGAAIVRADVLLENVDTDVQYSTRTNRDGIYLISNVPPGRYRLQVSETGFKTVINPDITLNVQGALAVNCTLPVGATLEVVTVRAGAPLVNTQSAAVSTVIDRNFAENLPLNGRSFNTLLQLTPGVVIAPSSYYSPGQFSIGGQRTDANNFTIDGVSANFGITAGQGASASGTGGVQAFSALGGTSSLVSVEDLQEFRVETSSFAPEFGRTPGGQVVLTTRSGTDDFHGGVYDYFRNTVMDANDWFANHAGNPRAREEHNDFGGYLGGPIAKQKTFFFFSFEGARLRLPQTSVINVPSQTARAAAPVGLAPFLNAYPEPTGPVSPAGDTAEFTGTYSNAGTLDATSIRVDHKIGRDFSLFGRYSYAPSQTTTRVYSLSNVQSTEANTQTVTVGLDLALPSGFANALRGNYSTQNAVLTDNLDSFGGAVPVAPGLILSSLPAADNAAAFLAFNATDYFLGPNSRNGTKQVQFADDATWVRGTHEIRLGGDYRGIFANFHSAAHDVYLEAPTVQGFVNTQQANLVTATLAPFRLLAQSLSLYVQDGWKPTPRLDIVYGLRWELSPAPTGLGSSTLFAWRNVDDPSQLAPATSTSPVWATTYGNVAPRLGIAYEPTSQGDFVIRAGAGIFYDLGVGSVSILAHAFPNSASGFTSSVSVPVSDVTPFLPSLSANPPYPNGIYGFDPHLVLPRSYQWNLALDKSFGGTQAVSLTYVGQAGRNLLRQEALYQPNPNFLGDFLLAGNSARSNYNALQIQYRRPLSSRLQTLFSYTWSHSLDNVSSDVVSTLGTVLSGESDYASSDFDIRQTLSGAFTFEFPTRKTGFASLLTRDWSIDGVVVARTGFPFNGVVLFASPDPGGSADSRPDLVPNQPLWLSDSNAPGRKVLNPAAFSIPSSARQGTEGRNDIAGFGLTQLDVSLQRKFALTDRLNLQFRADAFNVFNHPNFANPAAYVEFGPTYLQSEQMLNEALGGLNPLFQEGGPRSLQLSLKLAF